jgi:peptidoglycan hydrolase-like protein with peptidoglycan-binding domain
MNLTITDTYLEPNGQLREGNRPLFIILSESGKSNYSIYDMDADDKYENGKIMFRGHFYISKDGRIFRGRPINTFGEFAYDESRLRNFNVNSIGIVLEGDYTSELMPMIQKSATVLLIQYLVNEHESLKSIYGLDELVSGIDNPGIMFPLNEIIARALNLAIEPIRIAPNGTRRYAFDGRTLHYNPTKPIEGNDVKELQFIFSLLGYKCPLNGVYDSETMDAVITFQRSYNLIPDGIVGQETFDYIRKLSMRFYENRLTFNRILEVNSSNYLYGEDIRRLQNRLNLLGFRCIETGFYDEATADAVKGFQDIHNLIPDGKVGPITWQQITSDGYVFVQRVLSYTVPMIYGDDVRLVQQRLGDLGFSVGNPSSWYDEITRQQVMNFQATKGLEPNGIIDDKTSRALFN